MKHELLGLQELSLFNSDYAYADGYVRAMCTCGWESAPVPGKHGVEVHTAHAARETGPIYDNEADSFVKR